MGSRGRLRDGIDVRRTRRTTWPLPAALTASLLAGGCSAPDRCAPIPPSVECPDITLGGTGYNEWREYEGPPAAELQEVGDATYPACNVARGCPGSQFEGYGATDVWSLPSVDPADAVIGIRENSTTLVIFVRIGLDVTRLPSPTA